MQNSAAAGHKGTRNESSGKRFDLGLSAALLGAALLGMGGGFGDAPACTPKQSLRVFASAMGTLPSHLLNPFS